MDAYQVDVAEVVGLIVGLIFANWAALWILFKCGDKIDSARNLLWGISGEGRAENAEMVRFILKHDIAGFFLAVVWGLCLVGLALVIASLYLWDINVPVLFAVLYAAAGLTLIAAGLGIGLMAWRNYKEIEGLVPKPAERAAP